MYVNLYRKVPLIQILNVIDYAKLSVRELSISQVFKELVCLKTDRSFFSFLRKLERFKMRDNTEKIEKKKYANHASNEITKINALMSKAWQTFDDTKLQQTLKEAKLHMFNDTPYHTGL